MNQGGPQLWLLVIREVAGKKELAVVPGNYASGEKETISVQICSRDREELDRLVFLDPYFEGVGPLTTEE